MNFLKKVMNASFVFLLLCCGLAQAAQEERAHVTEYFQQMGTGFAIKLSQGFCKTTKVYRIDFIDLGKDPEKILHNYTCAVGQAKKESFRLFLKRIKDELSLQDISEDLRRDQKVYYKDILRNEIWPFLMKRSSQVVIKNQQRYPSGMILSSI